MMGFGLGISSAAQLSAILDANGRMITMARAGDTIFAVSPTAGDPPTAVPTIQWTLDGVDISGATGVSLVVPEGSGQIAWSGTDSAGAAVTSGAGVTILQAVAQPPAPPTTPVAAPVLSAFAIVDQGAGVGNLALTVDVASTAYIWIGPTGTTPTAAQVRAGTGADVALTQAVGPTEASYTLVLPDTLNGSYRVCVVAQVGGTGDLSDVVTESSVAFDTIPVVAPADPAFASWNGDQVRSWASARTLLSPSDTVTGDLLVLVLHGNQTAPNVTPPPGFAPIGVLSLPSGYVALFSGAATADGAEAYGLTFADNSEHSGFVMRFDPGGTVSDFATVAHGAGGDFPSGTVTGLSAGDLVVKISANDAINSTLTLDGAAPTVFDTPSSGSASLGVTVGVGFETVTGTDSTPQTWGRGFVNSASAIFAIKGT